MATQETVQAHPFAAGWRARLGPRAQIAVAAVLLLGVGIFAGNAYHGQQYGPEGAVRHYFSALQNGDAAGAYADLEVGALSASTPMPSWWTGRRWRPRCRLLAPPSPASTWVKPPSPAPWLS
jgi:hypothetical protein